MEFRVNELYNFLQKCALLDNKKQLNDTISSFIDVVHSWKSEEDVANSAENSKKIHIWEENLTQIVDSISLDRSMYYLKRMIRGLTNQKTGRLNDIDFENWKEYDDILTDSLWLFQRRYRTSTHNADYWGNFIPQIPNQLIRRFTKKGDTVLDPFLGSGTTAIESIMLKRNCVGVDISKDAIEHSKELTNTLDLHNTFLELMRGDSASINFKEALDKHNIMSVQLAILHPPYWDIIKFNEENGNLSGASSIDKFRSMFSNIMTNVLSVLEEGRFLAIVIGDSYKSGEWIPMGFYLMQDTMNLGLKLKSIVVKNYSDTRAKRKSAQLWRYRALKGNFYVFKHEYIFIFEKTKMPRRKKSSQQK